MISTISSREPRRKEKKEEWKICSLLLEFLPFHWLLCPRKKSWHPIHPPRHPLSRTSSLSLLIHLQLAISRRRHGIRQCSHDAKCNSNAVSVPVLRASGWGGGAGRGVEQRSLLIAAPILEHGRPEMEKSCREWTSRLLASAGFRGSVERTDRGKARPRLVIRVPGSSTIVFTWIPVQSVVSAVPGHGSHR